MVNTTCPVQAESLDYEKRGTSWLPMVWTAAVCTIATIAISLTLIVLHLRRYRSPKEQRQIIRIVFCVNIYAVVAFFEVWSYKSAKYIDPIGDYYEAFGLCALFLLFIQYAAPHGTYDDDLFTAVKAAEESQSTFDWPRIGWIFVFQYPLVETLCFFIIEVSEATGRYCVDSLSPVFAHLWVEILQSLGIGACVIAIIAFRNRMKSRMKVRRALAKIICFKIIVFIRFTQAWAFSILLEYDLVKTSSAFSYNDILWGIPGLCTCVEMVLFAAGFWYAFSSTEYGSSAKPIEQPLPLGQAVKSALNPTDLFTGIWRIFPLWMEVHRNGDWKLYRKAQKDEAVSAVRKSVQVVKKLKKRKANGSDGDQVLGDGMRSPLTPKLPLDSQRGRSTSDVTDVDTGYYSMTHMNPQEVYQPPDASPPEDPHTHLMAEPYHSRQPSPAQGPWNGQRYEPSPTSSPPPHLPSASAQGRDMENPGVPVSFL